MRMITDELLYEIVQRLVEEFQPEQVILFGSRVWGAPTSASDIDLMVIVPQSGLSEYERSVVGHRCLSGLDVAKDVLVRTIAEFDSLSEVPASLEYKVAHQGRILYDRRQDPTRAQLAHESET
jgi:uncharacterized protein